VTSLTQQNLTTPAESVSTVAVTSQTQWYKDAIVYELHVRAFADSNGDGIGDFPGLTERLDYLRDLGVTALWLLPFYPSPLRDDGYDIADYLDIHPQYGTLKDFKAFIKAAHERGLRVITELVVNHTSDQHPWFQEARRAPKGSAKRNFYVWSDSPEKYRDARIIFKDFEPSNWSWDPVAQQYYWHRFFSHQPDLNFDNPLVKKAVFNTLDYWLKMGVDGVRLDAVPYLFEREGTNCENLPETHEFLRELRAHVDKSYGDRMLLAEANQWPEDAAAYFGKGRGDEVHTAFHFPLMPRLFMGIRTESRFPIVDILEQTPPIPETAQWLTFLRNHDELTLEMVTDEERDYMYRVYATDPRARINLGIRRRLAPLLNNDRRRIELMNGLLFSLLGTPVLYYGDEIGMGDNIYLGDRNGVRTPMQWSSDRNAGFSRANPQRLYLPIIVDPEYHYEAINVEAQLANPSSLLWWTRQLIGLRKRTAALGRGMLEFLHPENRKILAFLRTHEEDRVLVLANLSKTAQYVELDLAKFRGYQVVELHGRSKFPSPSDQPYPVVLGPYDMYWLELKPPKGAAAGVAGALPQIDVSGMHAHEVWSELLTFRPGDPMEAALQDFMQPRRWYRGKARIAQALALEASVTLAKDQAETLSLVRVDYTEGEPQRYFLPMAIATGSVAEDLRRRAPNAGIAELLLGGKENALLYDPTVDPKFGKRLAQFVLRRRKVRSEGSELSAWITAAARQQLDSVNVADEGTLMRAEQSNTSFSIGQQLILKLFRTVEAGANPDVEIGRFLTEQTTFQNVPPLLGGLEFTPAGGAPMTVGVVQGFVKNEGDAWQYTLDYLGRYLERALVKIHAAQIVPVPTESLLELCTREPDDIAKEMVGTYLESARQLGKRTAELHAALSSSTSDPDFAPEPFSLLYQRSVYQTMRSQLQDSLQALRRQLGTLGPAERGQAEEVLRQEPAMRERLGRLIGKKMQGTRMRIHGDYHLGQVLWTGKDFCIIDFEGEPTRPLSQRRLKRSPLRDVAGMLRSFHYVFHTALDQRATTGIVQQDSAPLREWGRYWYRWVSCTFLRAYVEAAGPLGLIPKEPAELERALDAYMIDKALYELSYELNNRPTWVHVPMAGILDLLGGRQ
jgi:maltose alpha-D-glucosyltransferase / alpha-amylase